jgi:hypothetical protein
MDGFDDRIKTPVVGILSLYHLRKQVSYRLSNAMSVSLEYLRFVFIMPEPYSLTSLHSGAREADILIKSATLFVVR